MVCELEGPTPILKMSKTLILSISGGTNWMPLRYAECAIRRFGRRYRPAEAAQPFDDFQDGRKE